MHNSIPPFFKNLKSYSVQFFALLLQAAPVMPFYIGNLKPLPPFAGFIVIFYFAIYSPKHLSRSFIIILGLLQDIIFATPFGLSAFLNLAIHELIISQRKFFFREQFFFVWLGFVVFLLLYMLSMSVLCAIISKHWSFPPDIFMQFILFCAIYPIGHIFCSKLSRYSY